MMHCEQRRAASEARRLQDTDHDESRRIIQRTEAEARRAADDARRDLELQQMLMRR
jgi:hypothetical protein